MHSLLNKFVHTFILTVKIVGSLVESIHVFLAPWNVSWWYVICRLGFCSWLADSIEHIWIGIPTNSPLTFKLVRTLSCTHNISLSSLRVQFPWSRFNTSERNSITSFWFSCLWSATTSLSWQSVWQIALCSSALSYGTFLFTQSGWVQLASIGFDIIRSLVTTSSVSSKQKCWLELLEIGGRVSEAAASMWMSSLVATISNSSLTDFQWSLLNQLVIVLILFWNGGVRVLVVPWWAHLMMHHLVLGPVNVALQEITEVRVVVGLSLVPPEKTGDLILLLMLSVENWVISGASGLVVEVLGAHVADWAWDWSSHLGSRVEITDTLELNGLGRLDP